MKIAVLGATGRTGTHLVELLLDRGHDVSVLARNPSKLGPLKDRVHVVTGNSTDPEALDQLVVGTDAVISALGPTKRDEPDLHTRTAEALIESMNRHGVRRFVGISAAGVDIPGDQKTLLHRVLSLLVNNLGGPGTKDKPAEYRVWAASDLDWTLVRPPRLKDGPATGRVAHGTRSPGGSTISRADLAVLLVELVESGRYVRQAPFAWGG